MKLYFVTKNKAFFEGIKSYLSSFSIQFSIVESIKDYIDNIQGQEENSISIIEVHPQICSYETILSVLEKRRHSILITSDNLSNSLIADLLLKGADDYFHINMDSKIIFAKIMAHIRRAEGFKYPKDEISTSDGGLVLNRVNRSATIKHLKKTKNVQLSSREFSILYILVENEGKIVRRDFLLTNIWKDKAEELNSQTLDKYVQILREKLNSRGKRIKTIYGMGYVYEKSGENYESSHS